MDLLGCSFDLHYKNFAKWYLKTQTHFYLPRLRDNNRFTAEREVRIPPLSQTIDLQSIDTLLSEITVHSLLMFVEQSLFVSEVPGYKSLQHCVDHLNWSG